MDLEFTSASILLALAGVILESWSSRSDFTASGRHLATMHLPLLR